MKFLVECTAFAPNTTTPTPAREDHVYVDAPTGREALVAAKNVMRATWPEARHPDAGVMVASPRPIFLSIGHAIDALLGADLAYLIGYMIADGDDAMELDYAAGYVAAALYGGVDSAVDWDATNEVIKPRVAAAMRRRAAAVQASLVPEEELC